MPMYLIVRHGSNGANQPMRARAPVAIVEAKNRKDAEETEHDGSAHSSAWLVLAPEVKVWANQRIEAIPVSKASKADLLEVQENGAYQLP